MKAWTTHDISNRQFQILINSYNLSHFLCLSQFSQMKFVAVTVNVKSIDSIFTFRENVANLPIIFGEKFLSGEIPQQGLLCYWGGFFEGIWGWACFEGIWWFPLIVVIKPLIFCSNRSQLDKVVWSGFLSNENVKKLLRVRIIPKLSF